MFDHNPDLDTLPPKTLDAFNDHGTAALTIRDGVADARKTLDSLTDLGISLNDICAELLEGGVASFASAFEALLAAVEERRRAVPAS